MFNEDSDSGGEVEFKINKKYAAKYNAWREKEEFQKLKSKYGDEIDDESSSSESDDENAEELNEEIEKDFFKTLSCLKKKDPKIYDEKVNFFHIKSDEELEKKSKSKKKKEKPVYLKDHERKIILEKNGIASDEEDSESEDVKKEIPKSIVEEEKIAKENFKRALDEFDDDNDEELFTIKKRSKQEQEKEEKDYIAWLKGSKNHTNDKEAESEMKYLHDYWNNPKLDEGESFLRDYILNKKYLMTEENDWNVSNDVNHDIEDVSEDEKLVETQENFEHKFNFRFEEPDEEFIKRYPRIMSDTLRKGKDKRKNKRAEIKQRKLEEKERKQQELQQLKALKRKEILTKLDKLKKVTGNKEVGFRDDDLEEEFDPETHDARMQAIFNDNYYDEHDGEKPIFDEEEEIDGDIDNWDNWNRGESELHCEDPGFNMDADYDPQLAKQKREEDGGKKKKKKGKKNFSEMLKKAKPVFDPNEKSYEDYIDEYYKLDYEDVIGGDLPCRFKYRKVVPNDFGLTTEEILLADDSELNRWCSLKKTCTYRSKEKEAYEVKAYKIKGSDMNKKKNILSSIFKSDNEEKEANEHETKKDKKKKKKKVDEVTGVSDVRLRAYGINPTKYKNKLKYGKK